MMLLSCSSRVSQTPEVDVCTGPLRVLEQKAMQRHSSDDIQVLFYPPHLPVLAALLTLFDIWFRLKTTLFPHPLFFFVSVKL